MRETESILCNGFSVFNTVKWFVIPSECIFRSYFALNHIHRFFFSCRLNSCLFHIIENVDEKEKWHRWNARWENTHQIDWFPFQTKFLSINTSKLWCRPGMWPFSLLEPPINLYSHLFVHDSMGKRIFRSLSWIIQCYYHYVHLNAVIFSLRLDQSQIQSRFCYCVLLNGNTIAVNLISTANGATATATVTADVAVTITVATDQNKKRTFANFSYLDIIAQIVSSAFFTHTHTSQKFCVTKKVSVWWLSYGNFKLNNAPHSRCALSLSPSPSIFSYCSLARFR